MTSVTLQRQNQRAGKQTLEQKVLRAKEIRIFYPCTLHTQKPKIGLIGLNTFLTMIGCPAAAIQNEVKKTC